MADKSIGEIVREAENDFVSGETKISKYVDHSLHENIEQVYAYLNSKHISGPKDSLGRDKPFFNIVVAAANIWYRATDIDRKHIKLRATNHKDWVNSLIFNARIQRWMRVSKFHQFLNNWGRVLSRFGSAVVKIVENEKGLYFYVVPWNVLIVDAVNLFAAPRIEVIECSEAQLRELATERGYYQDQVEAMIDASKARETVGKEKKDSKGGYYKLYEIHGRLPKSLLTGEEEDDKEFVEQMQVLSFVATKKGRKTEYEDFILVKGELDEPMHENTHLIEEDGRTQSIGAVENLFESQWMENHSMKNIKDQLDLASKLFFQTSDSTFLGRNVITAIETGDIMIHEDNKPLNPVNNQTHDITNQMNFAVQWKQLGNEINGISEAMLGTQPKSGTAWRQTEALLTESYSLFELMTENKSGYIENWLRERIIPYHKKKLLNDTDEIVAILDSYDIQKIDEAYLKNKSAKIVNDKFIGEILDGKYLDEDLPSPEEFQAVQTDVVGQLEEGLTRMGNERFFEAGDMGKRAWAEQFEGIENDIEIDINGEARDVQENLTTLNTALKLMMTPGFDQNKKAQSTVGKILELTGAMSPMEYNSLPDAPQGGGSNVPDVTEGKEEITSKERNIKK